MKEFQLPALMPKKPSVEVEPGTALTARKVSKHFCGRCILHAIDLEVACGETLVIMGPSGHGKTVLLKCLAGLMVPDAGCVCLGNGDISKLIRKRRTPPEQRTAFVFQNDALLDSLNVRDNLSLFLQMHTAFSERTIARMVQDALDFIGLGADILEKFPEQLSGGMKKRVAIARAVLQDCRWIFYDDPTAGLDRGNQAKVVELIRRLKTDLGVASIIATHDRSLMRTLSDRVALLWQGEVIWVGRHERLSDAVLSELNGGRFHPDASPRQLMTNQMSSGIFRNDSQSASGDANASTGRSARPRPLPH